MLRKIADLNTVDLLLCEKMPGGLKLSSGILKSELVAYANTYGYLFPPEAQWPHMPHKSVPPLETDKAKWDAWVQLLCASQGRAIVRARFAEEGEVGIPGGGKRGRWSFRLGPFTPESVAESYRNWTEMVIPTHKDERPALVGTSHTRSWMQPAGTLFLHSETHADRSIDVSLNLRDHGAGLEPEIASVMTGGGKNRKHLPEGIPATLSPMLIEAIPWEPIRDPLIALENVRAWADAAGDLLWRALTEIGELS